MTILVGGATLASATLAADDNKILYPASGATASAPAGGGFGSMSLILGAALAAVGVWLVWRGRRNSPRAAGGSALAIEETRSLGNRQYLVVASYENKKFLLGVCPGRIDHLAPLHDEKPRA
jgi:flagellar protein FliO/FliZ